MEGKCGIAAAAVVVVAAAVVVDVNENRTSLA